MVEAVVVGSGPNGLAAAITLARGGVKVTVLEASRELGGGARSGELSVPGIIHDHCSAVHPLGVASPFMRSLAVDCPPDKALKWKWPLVNLAHPLDNGSAGVLRHSLADTARVLGPDGPAWNAVFGPLTRTFDTLGGDILRPLLNPPSHPLTFARFGAAALLPASVLSKRWRTPAAKALYGGVAAHQFRPLTAAATAGPGLLLITAAHRFGWPVAAGGSQAITDALVGTLLALGGSVETGITVTSVKDLEPADVIMLDLMPGAAADLIGDRLPARVRRGYRRFRHGPGAFKVDFVIDGDIPWRHADCRRAGTVHLGGDFNEIGYTENEIWHGRMPYQPFVLVCQQYLADPSRSSGTLNPIWSYAHVPHGYTGDTTDAIIRQIERFAPGFREQIVAQHVRSPLELSAYNANYVGGDILGGANTARQLVGRPRLTFNPYSTDVPGLYLCSAATPPGAGVHGMCGYNAARIALKKLTTGRAT